MSNDDTRGATAVTNALSTPDDALELARERTGLTDIGSDSWREGLAVLLGEMNASTGIAPHGIDYLTENIVAALSNRLRVNDYVRRHP
jgi:hypothetical protein